MVCSRLENLGNLGMREALSEALLSAASPGRGPQARPRATAETYGRTDQAHFGSVDAYSSRLPSACRRLVEKGACSVGLISHARKVAACALQLSHAGVYTNDKRAVELRRYILPSRDRRAHDNYFYDSGHSTPTPAQAQPRRRADAERAPVSLRAARAFDDTSTTRARSSRARTREPAEHHIDCPMMPAHPSLSPSGAQWEPAVTTINYHRSVRRA